MGILLPNNQRQHRSLHVQKDVLPYLAQTLLFIPHLEVFAIQLLEHVFLLVFSLARYPCITSRSSTALCITSRRLYSSFCI